MTARQFAALVDAREIKRGKLWKARCPAHNGKGRSLDISDGKRGVLLTCWSYHCTVKEICGALGIKVSDLFDERASPEIRRRVGLREQKDRLERQLGLVMFLRAIDKGKERYWAAAEKRLSWEVFWIRCTLEPEKVIQEHRKRMERK